MQQYQDYLNQAQAAQAAEQSRAQLGLSSSLALGGQEANLSASMQSTSAEAYAQMISAMLGAQTNAINAQYAGNTSLQNTGRALLLGA